MTAKLQVNRKQGTVATTIRLPKDLHRKAKIHAAMVGVSLQELTATALVDRISLPYKTA